MPASASDVLSSLQNVVQAINAQTRVEGALTPTNTSGQLSANTLIQTGFVRVTGVSVETAGAAGTLNDAATIALAVSGTEIFTTPATAGFYPVNMVFLNGLVYKPGSGQKVAVFYTRV